MTDGQLEIIFRKSDVKWRENSRGWEMMLSYSFETGITSGYLKGTKNADIETLVKHHVHVIGGGLHNTFGAFPPSLFGSLGSMAFPSPSLRPAFLLPMSFLSAVVASAVSIVL